MFGLRWPGPRGDADEDFPGGGGDCIGQAAEQLGTFRGQLGRTGAVLCRAGGQPSRLEPGEQFGDRGPAGRELPLAGEVVMQACRGLERAAHSEAPEDDVLAAGGAGPGKGLIEQALNGALRLRP